MTRRLLFLSIIVFVCSLAYSQRVTNVRAEQKGDSIVVSYDLSAKADVSVRLKVDNKRRPIKRVSGAVGKAMEKGKDKAIVWNVLADNPDGFEEDNVVFTVKANPVWRTFLVAEGAVSPVPLQGSGGFMVGRAARWGYYLKFRSSFMFAPSNNGVFQDNWIEVDDERTLYSSSDIKKLITGRKKNTELICDAGAMYNFSMNTDYPMLVYLGLGYGMRRQMWEFKDNIWLKYGPTAFEGVSVDLGMMFSLKNFIIDVGVNTINFQYAEIQFGLGWLFNK